MYQELRKHAGWYDEDLKFYHFRNKDKVEVDILNVSLHAGGLRSRLTLMNYFALKPMNRYTSKPVNGKTLKPIKHKALNSKFNTAFEPY
ncbi:DUF4143 domain-containing protein [Idiomarina sp. M1R2S28]|uniref:DUF4143 domain-containing protein n=1 Tax=Idiomarina rhizosphaerae TaxID=2961572 RepID=A0A9X2JR86_9GAMM|nr:DUF4143 domain-containing protein [Idiomarina rhizosphaerae]